ncbi:MAG: PAS domain S-box protein [Comamonadaceae bacterium]|nr:PAS domain S-box protein [Comamonadaceae bacterium]
MLRADGRTLTVNQRVLPLYEAGRRRPAMQPRYVMSIIDDLTEEVRAEAALRETETRFRQFAENIDQLVFIATADLASVLYVNPRYAAVIGGPLDELLEDGRNALKHVHFDDVPALKRRLPRLIGGFRRLRKAEVTVRIDHPTRGLRTLNLRLNPVRMFDGSVRVFGVADDITERAAAEQAAHRRGDQAARHPGARGASPDQEQPAGRGRAAAAHVDQQARGGAAAERDRQPDPGHRPGARAADPRHRHAAGAGRGAGHRAEPGQHVRRRRALRAAGRRAVEVGPAGGRGGAAGAGDQRAGHQRA